MPASSKVRSGRVPSFGFYYDVGTGHFFGVEPPVVSCGELEGKLVVLVVVFAYIDIVAIAGNIVEGLGLRLHFGAFFVSVMAFCT